MKFFYLSSTANASGNYEVHEKECEFIPGSLDRDYLGPFNNGREALRKAVSLNPQSVCCESCCKSPVKAIFRTAPGKE
ncbi:hypothetical protein J0A67_11840 [Algoriphagus aestuariicola]|uniref:Uncharacterized protein n=1 Tax=Algoriphagus aestuariicola TaxID=1852016 RepID=A0ABS3BQJ0_9BACT|nr:hypothetical protein [Algoriphagus aestuariicola]MBN7801557.1 hypothetical protein [Algoriphagus aestuariicola]